jgi:hypothetical protein
MSDLGAFAPPGESANDLWVERSNLNGVILAGVAYGKSRIFNANDPFI